jgi:phage terminase large subunit-like protein
MTTEAAGYGLASDQLSLAQQLQQLPAEERDEILAGYDPKKLLYDWSFWARPDQLPPTNDFDNWVILAGRGWGKTRTGAQWTIGKARLAKNRRIAIVGETSADVRDVMVEGESGIMGCSPPDFRPKYEPTKRRLTWPNGAMATTFSGDRPDQLRGPQHHDAWVDELAKMRYGAEAMAMLDLSVRLGRHPQILITTTPRPIKLLKEILADEGTIVTTGSTYENLDNLSPSFRRRILRRYEGTRLGRQELYAEILEDVPGALWNRDMLDHNRRDEVPQFVRTVVAIDPAVSVGEDADETGIVTAGMDANGHGWVFNDSSGPYSPDEWASTAVQQYNQHKADVIVGERNNGGELVELTVRTVDPKVNFKSVWASKGKYTRAEPIAALYEQGKVHHVGSVPQLEDEMCTYTPETAESPNRMDAAVWALSELMLESNEIHVVKLYGY